MKVYNFNFLNEHYIIIALLLVIIYLFTSHSSNICPHCQKDIVEGFGGCGGYGKPRCPNQPTTQGKGGAIASAVFFR